METRSKLGNKAKKPAFSLSPVCERSPTKVCENHALDSDSVSDSNLCFKKIRFRPRIESALSIGFGFGFD